ncbi:hypothetical protein [Nostoc sp. KVJ20]|uniref:hypothetical protein n=1 Tax=Nostoc sp. KVJ20 TaxID=457944 RepID=UPI00159F3446|nr:hypothetical protein [Nostoc sp. KVJ20]
MWGDGGGDLTVVSSLDIAFYSYSNIKQVSHLQTLSSVDELAIAIIHKIITEIV